MRRSVRIILGLVAMAGIVWGLVQGWGLLGREPRRILADGFLRALLVGYVIAAVVALAGTLVLGIAVLKAQRPQRMRRLRALAFCLSCLCGVVLAETGGTIWQAWAHRMPRMPTTYPAGVSGKNRLHFVMVGESTAQTEPYGGDAHSLETRYYPWFSIPQLIGSAFETVRPELKVSVELVTEGGIPLEVAQRGLGKVRRKPDAVLVYAGHNEFQARYQWSRTVRPWSDETAFDRLIQRFASASAVVRTIRETLDKIGLDLAPSEVVTRDLIDAPTCTREEYRALVEDFERRLETIVLDCERLDAVPILFVPAANDSGFEPNRSVLPVSATDAQKQDLRTSFVEARQAERTDPGRALTLYRGLVERFPGFAEAHFRLARQLEKVGKSDEAAHHDTLARDLDGLPLRCQTPFQDAYRRVAARHPSAILIDGPQTLRALSPNGLLDDRLFHDAHHPTLAGYVALAQAALDAIAERGVLGWPEGKHAPRLDPDRVVREYTIDAGRWSVVCTKSAMFYRKIAYIRHDPAARLAHALAYELASKAVLQGTPPEDAGIPGLGTHPKDVLTPASQAPAP